MQYKNIFSIRVAKHLMALGEKCHNIKPNKKIPGHTVFVFEVGPEFDDHMRVATERKSDTEKETIQE